MKTRQMDKPLNDFDSLVLLQFVYTILFSKDLCSRTNLIEAVAKALDDNELNKFKTLDEKKLRFWTTQAKVDEFLRKMKAAEGSEKTAAGRVPYVVERTRSDISKLWSESLSQFQIQDPCRFNFAKTNRAVYYFPTPCGIATALELVLRGFDSNNSSSEAFLTGIRISWASWGGTMTRTKRRTFADIVKNTQPRDLLKMIESGIRGNLFKRPDVSPVLKIFLLDLLKNPDSLTRLQNIFPTVLLLDVHFEELHRDLRKQLDIFKTKQQRFLKWAYKHIKPLKTSKEVELNLQLHGDKFGLTSEVLTIFKIIVSTLPKNNELSSGDIAFGGMVSYLANDFLNRSAALSKYSSLKTFLKMNRDILT
ncbi:MAG: hypothetical protein EBQ92_14325 [Proteobacteria bacterium]|nr:hypothetical protein [Pseudomonadota bacterium]